MCLTVLLVLEAPRQGAVHAPCDRALGSRNRYRDVGSRSSLEPNTVKWALCTVAQRAFSLLSPIDGLLRLMLRETQRLRQQLLYSLIS